MYDVHPYESEIRIISNIDGVVGVYPNYEAFIEDANYMFVETHVVTTFKDWPIRWFHLWKFNETYPRFIVRDKFGSVFSSTEILHDIRNKNRNASKWTSHFARRYDFVHRETPVPYTGGKRGHFRSWYKTPKTTQEKRWSIAHREYVRGKRSKSYLPDSWDDRPRSDIRIQKSWKRFRKTQWKNQNG